MSGQGDHERYEALLMKAVDERLAPSEAQQLDRHLADCPSCAAELADFRRIKSTTDAMTARILRDVEIEPPRPTVGASWAMGASFALLLAGALLLVGYAVYALFGDPAVPLVVKLGAGAMGVGGLGLLAYVLRVRSRARGRDPYEEIDR